MESMTDSNYAWRWFQVERAKLCSHCRQAQNMILKFISLLCSRPRVSLENDFVLQICWCTNDIHGLANG